MNNTKRGLIEIAVSEIDPHPKNPRQSLGELAELKNSILQKGILQNLTVVPNGARYTVIIGHRRLAAAKLAGLKVVPCAVVEMDEREQVSTMLLENMQRQDLSIYEQVQGVQMMIDLGETINSISEQTGLSKTTVRNRLKLADLPKELFKESAGKQATLEDYIEISKLKNEETKKQLLSKIGRSDFNNALAGAVEKEKNEQLAKEIKKILSEKGIKPKPTKIAPDCHFRYLKHLRPEGVKEYKPPKGEQIYFEMYNVNVYLYKKQKSNVKTSNKNQSEEEIEKENEKKRKSVDTLNALKEQYFYRRQEFIRNLPDVNKETLLILCIGGYVEYMPRKTIQQLFNLSEEQAGAICEALEKAKGIYELGEAFILALKKEKGLDPLLILLILVWEDTDDIFASCFDTWEGTYTGGDKKSIFRIYADIEKFGYIPTDEEKEILNGTHEAYYIPPRGKNP